MTARLVLLNTDTTGGYKCAKIYDEYTITCRAGPAYTLNSKAWFVVALEVDGKRVPFQKSEKLKLKIFDEKDPDIGVSLLASYTSVAWKNGLHYFKSIDWQQVGQYRMTIKPSGMKRFGGDENVQTLQHIIRCADPGMFL